MMFNQKFAAAIKVNGKVLREFKDTVYVRFASEYSITLKNLNTRRAIVNVFIDGEDQTPGGLIIDAGRQVDLERSIKNNNLTEGNKFKFIERTGAVEAHRGVKLEDGIVRVEFEFEREQPQWATNSTTTWTNPGFNPRRGWINEMTCTYGGYYDGAQASIATGYNVNGALRRADFSKGESVKAQASAAVNQYLEDNGISIKGDIHDGAATMDCYFNEAGITVPGSKSEQKFTTISGVYGDGIKHNIVLKILGETPNNKPVLKEVTVKAKPKCVTCGRQNKATAKFCQECGTALEIFA